MRHSRDRSSSGFTLLETVVATAILVTALAGIAELMALSLRLARDSGRRAVAVIAAQVKMESLCALTFAYTADGDAIGDPALKPSPPDTLSADVEEYFELLDADGQVIFSADRQIGAFTRRWAIMPREGGTPETLVIEVCVFREPAARAPVAAADACLATIRSRRP